MSSYSIEPAELWIDFVDKLRGIGHSLPGNYYDLAMYARDALVVLDPNHPVRDEDDTPAHLWLSGSFDIICDGLAQLGHEATPTPSDEV